MKFNLSDFLQLDTKELLAVNGGSPCSGPTTGPSNNASDPTSPSYGSGGNDGNGGGSSGPGAVASGSGGGGCSPSNNPSKPGGSKNPENNKPGNNSDVGSGGGACSPTNSKAPDTGNPDSSNPDNNIRSGGGECSAQEPKTSETRDDKYGTTIRDTIYPDGHGTREVIDTKTGEVISSGPIAPHDSGKNDNSTKSTSSEANTNSGRTESGTGASSVGNDGTKGTQDSPSTHESEGSGSHNSNGQGSSTTSSNPGGNSGTTSDSTKNNGSNGNNSSGNVITEKNASQKLLEKIYAKGNPKDINLNEFDPGEKKYCYVKGSYQCDEYAEEIVREAGYDSKKYCLDNPSGKYVDDHINDLIASKKSYQTDPSKLVEGAYVVFMTDKEKELESHAALMFVNSDGSAFLYDNSSHNFEYKDKNGNRAYYGGIEKTSGTSASDVCGQFNKYENFYFQKVN